MKKIYQQPTLTVVKIDASLPIATSIVIVNNPQDNIVGDVKVNEWADIWDDPLEDEE